MSEQGGGTAGQELDPALQERIARAIAPVLADFEQQVVQVVEERMAAAPPRDSEAAPGPQTTVSSEPGDPSVSPPDGNPDEGAPSEDASVGDERHQDEGGESLVPLLRQAVHGLERESGDWVRSLLTNALDALFSEPVRAAIQEQLNRSTRVLTDDIYAGITDDPESQQELEGRTEQLLQDLVDDLLRNLFDGSLRQEVEYHGDEAVRALTRLDFDLGLHHIQEALEALVMGIVKVLGRHWAQVLKLLLKIVVEFFQDSVGSAVSEGFAGAVNVVSSSMDAQERGQAVQEQFEEKTSELGEKLRETSETLRERIAESSEQLRSRLGDGGTDGHQLGRPPKGRQLGKAPTGKPPAGPGRSNRR